MEGRIGLGPDFLSPGKLKRIMYLQRFVLVILWVGYGAVIVMSLMSLVSADPLHCMPGGKLFWSLLAGGLLHVPRSCGQGESVAFEDWPDVTGVLW